MHGIFSPRSRKCSIKTNLEEQSAAPSGRIIHLFSFLIRALATAPRGAGETSRSFRPRRLQTTLAPTLADSPLLTLLPLLFLATQNRAAQFQGALHARRAHPMFSFSIASRVLLMPG